MTVSVLIYFSILIATVLGSVSQADIYSGKCLCVDGVNVNARITPTITSNVGAVVSRPTCFKSMGATNSSGDYLLCQIRHSGQNLWIAGKYLQPAPDRSCGSTSNQCPAGIQEMACALLANATSGVLQLARQHSSGKTDNAYAYNNIRDTCNGLQAARSSYNCSECRTGAPGGAVCLTKSLLSYLAALVSKGRVIVNELAGGCHSCSSKHYGGLAVDLHNDARSSEYIKTCNAMGGRGLDEKNHIHCQFNN